MEPPINQRPPSPADKLTVVLDHLSGFHRGGRQLLAEDSLEIGTAPNVTVHFPADDEPSVRPRHVRISRRGNVYELESVDGSPVRVNGSPVERHLLSSGDLIIVGDGGPVIRFRTYGQTGRRYKSIPEALADCRDFAVAEKSSAAGRLLAFLRQAPHEILQQTAPWTRTLTFALVTILILATLVLAFMSFQLQRELSSQAAVLSIVQPRSWRDYEW